MLITVRQQVDLAQLQSAVFKWMQQKDTLRNHLDYTSQSEV